MKYLLGQIGPIARRAIAVLADFKLLKVKPPGIEAGQAV